MTVRRGKDRRSTKMNKSTYTLPCVFKQQRISWLGKQHEGGKVNISGVLIVYITRNGKRQSGRMLPVLFYKLIFLRINTLQ